MSFWDDPDFQLFWDTIREMDYGGDGWWIEDRLEDKLKEWRTSKRCECGEGARGKGYIYSQSGNQEIYGIIYCRSCNLIKGIEDKREALRRLLDTGNIKQNQIEGLKEDIKEEPPKIGTIWGGATKVEEKDK